MEQQRGCAGVAGASGGGGVRGGVRSHTVLGGALSEPLAFPDGFASCPWVSDAGG